MATSAIRTNERSARATPFRLTTRLRLIGVGIGLVALTLITLAVANNAYTATLNLFRTLVEVNAAKVNASEAALSAIARVDSQAADFIATAQDDPKHWSSLDGVHSSFSDFRAQMFTVRANLASEEEQRAYAQVERFAFDDFWQHIGNLLTAQINGDRAAAIRAYITADNYLQNQVVPNLLTLETLNYQAMEQTRNTATGIIAGRTLVMNVIAFGLAIALTAVSFWVRRKVRRYITPGLDIAMVLAWVIAVLLFLDLARTPGQLNLMVNDSYRSVTGAARVLAVANQADITQSGAVIDSTSAADWNTRFDTYIANVEQRLCGPFACLRQPFTSSADTIPPSVRNAARNVAIENLPPLVGNVTFAGEAAALERARAALNEYLTINKSIRDLLTKGQVDDASFLSTGDAKGQSAEAFTRFTTAMDDLSRINVQVFDQTWTDVQNTLNRNMLWYILIGYVLVVVGIIAGVIQRERELR